MTAPVSGLDVGTPSVARIYDYMLGGKDNYEIDRHAARKVVEVFPGAPRLARANREFAGRAARWCAHAGVGQFVDVGTGLPGSPPSVFDVVRQLRPDARIIGVDNDPVVLVHNRALLESGERVRILEGDVRELGDLLARLSEVIDWGRPVAVLFVALLHLLRDAEEPRRVVGRFVDRLAPGSLVVISHVTSTDSDPAAVASIEKIYAGASAPAVFRSEAEITDLFAGLQMCEPGLVDVADWRPDDDAEHEPPPVRVVAGVGRVPGGAP